MAIEIGDFVLEPYDIDNINHRCVSVVLDNDDDFRDYVGETQYLVDNARIKQDRGFNDQTFIIRNKNDYLGILSLIILDGKPYLTIGIIPERQGMHYGKNVLREYIEYIFHEYPDYYQIFVSINPHNEKSINNCLKLGFVQETKTKYVKTRD